MSQPTYNLRNMRKLLTAAFTDEELSKLCYEIPEFRPVYEQFATGMSKDQKIQRLIEYCERKVLLGQLVQIIKEEASEKYNQFLEQNMPVVIGEIPPTSSAPSSSSPGVDNHKFLQDMIALKIRTLQYLQLQAAKYGISVPVHIALEIEDLEKEIEKLEQQLNERSTL